MSVDYKRCNEVCTNSVIIIVPNKNKTKIHSTILIRLVDLEYNLKYYDLNNEMVQELREQVQYLFNEGYHSISLVQSENCKDIIVLI
jgi:ribulose bisphosphate carboxylase small subunit